MFTFIKSEGCANMEQTSGNLSEGLVAKKNTISIVWAHFGFCAVDIKKKEFKNKSCRKTVSTTIAITTNLFQHSIK